MNSYGPTIKHDGDPITYDAQGKPVVRWRSYQRPVTSEPFVALSVSMNVTGVGTFTNTLWRVVGDYWWARLVMPGRAILGMHLTQRTIGGGLIECALAINNGTCLPGQQDSWCGAVTFDSLKISAPHGWQVAAEPLAIGVEFFPSLATRIFRFVLYREGLSNDAHAVLNCGHLRFDEDIPIGPANTLVSWRQTMTAPQLNVRRFGIWSPHGDPSSDMVSGTDIYPLYCLGLPLARAHRERFDYTAQRQRNIAYHAEDGRVIGVEEWGHWFDLKLQRGNTHDQRNPTFTSGDSTRDPWQDKFFNNPEPCPYWRDLDAYKPHDDAHGCRAIMDAITTAVLCNDVLARLYLQCQAHEVMLSMNMTSPGPVEPTYPGEWIKYSMARLENETAKRPHAGCWEITRAVGWKYTTVAAGLQLTPPGPAREYGIKWAGRALSLAENSVLPCHMPEDGRYPNANNGVPWQPEYGLQPHQGCVPNWQVPFWAHGVYSLALQAHGGRMRAATKALIMDSATALYSDDSKYQTYEYDSRARGPFYYGVTSENGVPVPKMVTGSKKTEPLHARHHLALAALVATNDRERKLLTNMACKVSYPQPNATALANSLNPINPWEAQMWTELRQIAPVPA